MCHPGVNSDRGFQIFADVIYESHLAVDLSVGRVVDGDRVEVAAARGAGEAALVPRLQQML